MKEWILTSLTLTEIRIANDAFLYKQSATILTKITKFKRLIYANYKNPERFYYNFV